MWIDLLLLTIILVYVIDLTDATDTLKKIVSFIVTSGKYVKTEYSLRPFDCSLCATFWLGMFYLAFTSNFTLLGVAYVCMLSYLTTTLKNILLFLKDVCDYIIIYFDDLVR